MEVDCVPCELDDIDDLPCRDGDHQLQQWQRQLNQLDADLDSMHKLMDMYSGWDLRIVNGSIYLESRIRSLHELIEYNRASIRYLSPFQHFIRREHIQFQGVSASVALASTGLIVRHATPNKASRHLICHGIHEKARERMNSLIYLYMTRYNPLVGFLHAPTFRAYYRRLEDPLSSALALAVCVDTIAYFYPQLEYSVQEKRELAEFFYTRCRDLLLDMYDDPTRRWEAVIATALLMQYLMDVLLEHSEARRLITIALLASHELENQELSLLESVLLHRALIALQVWSCSIDLIVEDKFDFSWINDQPVVIFDDEPKSLRVYFIMWYNLLDLAGSPYITTLMERVRYSVLHGDTCELSLDLILQYEPTIQTWWKNLPKELRLCEDPFDLKSARQAIENAPSSTHLMTLAVFYVITAMIQSTLLQPLSPIDEQGNEDIIRILRERALSLTMTSTQALIHIMKKNLEVDIDAVPLSFTYMMGVLHSVCNIVSCLHIQLPPEMQSMLLYCFTQLHSMVLSGHHIPESATKLLSFITTRKSNPIVIYEQFPMPRLAMLSDIFHTCFRQLNSIVHLSS
ncbi:hypothetical protein BJV82DRAFT_625500 [Fennellomyces sp. T-0311]|nr:hypothetical protein BJV82DRAFT_625500 [Fennellomyces sp. T-0311]